MRCKRQFSICGRILGLFPAILWTLCNPSIVFADPGERILSGSLTYERALGIATDESPSAQSFKLRTSAEDLRTGYLLRSFAPRILGHAGYEEFREGTFSGGRSYFGLDAILNIYSGGLDRSEDFIRNARYHLARANLTRNQIEIAKKVADAYLAATVSLLRIETIRALVDETEKLHKSAGRRVKSGISTNTDLLEFEIYNKKLSQEVVTAQIAFAQAKTSLAQLLGYERADAKLEIDKSIPHLHWKENPISGEEVSAWTGDLQNAASDLAHSEFLRSATWWRPRLDLYSSYGIDALSQQAGDLEDGRPIQKEFAYGIRLSFPIFDGLSNYKDASAQKLLAEADVLLARNNRLEQNASLQNLILSLEQNDRLLHTASEVVDLTQKYLVQTLGEYARGVKNSVDALSALQRLKDARYEVLDLEQRYATGRAELEFARRKPR